MEKVAELCAAEQKFIDKMRLVVQHYGALLCEASDPETPSGIQLVDFPSIIHQHRSILEHFQSILSVHEDLYGFWTVSVEDFFDLRRCGEVFYNELVESFDVHLDHIVGNPLRFPKVQSEFTRFFETYNAEDVLLLTGYECYQLPIDQIHFYFRAFQEIVNSDRDRKTVPKSVLNSMTLLRKLIQKMKNLQRVMGIPDCGAFLPELGTFVMCSEVTMRDVINSEICRMELFLFKKSILLAKHKNFTMFKRNSDLEFVSCFPLDQLQLIGSSYFRLIDPVSKKTLFKVVERRRRDALWDTVEVRSEFMKMMESIAKLKSASEASIYKPTLTSFDLVDQEVINFRIFEGRRGQWDGYLNANGALQEHTFLTSQSQAVTVVEAFNFRLCNALQFNRHTNDPQDHQRVKLPTLSARNNWKRLLEASGMAGDTQKGSATTVFRSQSGRWLSKY